VTIKGRVCDVAHGSKIGAVDPGGINTIDEKKKVEWNG